MHAGSISYDGNVFSVASRGGTVRVSVSSRALFVLVTRMVAMGSKLSDFVKHSAIVTASSH